MVARTLWGNLSTFALRQSWQTEAPPHTNQNNPSAGARSAECPRESERRGQCEPSEDQLVCSDWTGNGSSESETGAVWSFRELTEQESAIHVAMPILGKTHNWRTNQPTRSPTTTAISIGLPRTRERSPTGMIVRVGQPGTYLHCWAQ